MRLCQDVHLIVVKVEIYTRMFTNMPEMPDIKKIIWFVGTLKNWMFDEIQKLHVIFISGRGFFYVTRKIDRIDMYKLQLTIDLISN